MTELKQNKEGIWYRDNGTDINMLRDSNIGFDNSDYKEVYPLGLIVMDCGANIGGFSVRALDHGAKKVIAYEPNPDNYEVLVKNLEGKSRSFSNNTALVSDSNIETITFYNSNSKRNTCSGSINKPRTKSVETIVPTSHFETEVNIHKPNVIKMDIEGAEYDILIGYKFPNHVEQFAIELHHGSKKQRELFEILYPELVEQFGEPLFKKEIIYFKKHNLTICNFSR